MAEMSWKRSHRHTAILWYERSNHFCQYYTDNLKCVWLNHFDGTQDTKELEAYFVTSIPVIIFYQTSIKVLRIKVSEDIGCNAGSASAMSLAMDMLAVSSSQAHEKKLLLYTTIKAKSQF